MIKVKAKREQPTLKDPMRFCTVCNKEYKAIAPLQKSCSKECRAIIYKANHKRFKEAHPNSMLTYNQNRLKKNPNVWKDKVKAERVVIIEKLGGKCSVEKCKVKNIFWLHVDYIPTMIGTGYRHPRYKKWILDHIEDFRLLCANHHYELTITGKIKGSNIKQKTRETKL